MLSRWGEHLRAWASRRHPHTNVYGLARSLLALGTAGTLLFTDTYDLFRPASGFSNVLNCSGIAGGSLFCLAGREHLGLAHAVAVATLLVVASGWLPRITGIVHWYLSASLFLSAQTTDGGDQITMILTFLLLPVTMADRRRWHWEAPVEAVSTSGNGLLSTGAASAQILALSCFLMIRVQMAGVYFQAATAKMSVPEWRDGTALYYYFTNPWFGLTEPLKSWAMPLLADGFVVTTMTWGAMLLEIFLFAGLIAERPFRKVLLRLGIAFHVAIALVFGLVSFTLAMCSGLLLFLHPVDEEFAALRARGGKLIALVERSPLLLRVRRSPRAGGAGA